MRRVLIAGGLILMAYAVGGALLDDQVDLAGIAVFGLAVLILHDVVFLPLVLLAGRLLPRLTPTLRIITTAWLAVTIVALPLVLGFGRDPGNPTILPRSYGTDLIGILIGTAVTVLACRKGIERLSDGRRRRPPG
ncbi:hypothetical protein ACWT_4574 [Actinoplanes sp. SE50]|uniref:hypothetical protein n=1 Tax=unclassified Actinoplanes TaxID=2626549 RepID=UPI00023ED28C|nr:MULTISPECIES: hypothetical protein [unclassified Actinoplanes]AEV85596.1 hypothetical protein ACPL_4705 [Actinoplanes sp. SE50/110]ATO83989.1 hypothetical protein ACWT_4574 [Actinoplanes sp. SE50]SLM01399.1 hypothetical protein ACSP50_4635 [Actinoplanes sp. SE50/110]